MYKIAISPCPNDTFVFEHFAKVWGHEVDFFDIQELNELALKKGYDVIKVSFGSLPLLLGEYQLLRVGSALGYGNGPVLIGKKKVLLEEVEGLRIAVPGKLTTANMLLRYFFGNAKRVSYHRFSEIQDLVLNEVVDLGVIIHEQRFTFEKRGLEKVVDLGELWQEHEREAVPLGCLMVRRGLSAGEKWKIQEGLQESIRHAKGRENKVSAYIKEKAQEMEDEVILKHIELYVNDYTYYLDDKAIGAVCKLIQQIYPEFVFPVDWYF